MLAKESGELGLTHRPICRLLVMPRGRNPTVNQTKTMTKIKFVYLCGVHTIDPVVAQENPDIIAALKAHDDDEVERLLREAF
jgi:hypothetical protein